MLVFKKHTLGSNCDENTLGSLGERDYLCNMTMGLQPLMVVLMMMFGGNGGNEILDYVDTGVR